MRGVGSGRGEGGERRDSEMANGLIAMEQDKWQMIITAGLRKLSPLAGLQEPPRTQFPEQVGLWNFP